MEEKRTGLRRILKGRTSRLCRRLIHPGKGQSGRIQWWNLDAGRFAIGRLRVIRFDRFSRDGNCESAVWPRGGIVPKTAVILAVGVALMAHSAGGQETAAKRWSARLFLYQ